MMEGSGRKLVLIVWLFVGIVVCLLALVVYSVSLLSSGRALVAICIARYSSAAPARCGISGSRQVSWGIRN